MASMHNDAQIRIIACDVDGKLVERKVRFRSCISVYMYVCMYVLCMCVCMYVCMDACMCV